MPSFTHPRVAIIVACLLLGLSCAARPSTDPFLLRGVEKMALEVERSDAIGPGEAISPRSGSPYKTYEVRLEAGEVAHFTVTSGAFHPGLSLFTDEGLLVGSSRQATEGRAELTRRAPRTGAYYLVVSAEGSGSFGPFDLGGQVLEVGGDLSIPASVEGRLFDSTQRHPTTGGFISAYALELHETTGLEVTLRSSDFDAFLSIAEMESGRVVAQNDDFGGTTDSRILTELPPGAYEIWASSFEEGGGGRYTLAAEEAEIVRSAELELGVPYQGFLGHNREPVPMSERIGEPIHFEISAPAQYDFVMRSEDLDSYLVLTGEDGRVVTEDDDSGGGLDARITVSLEPGRYTLWATSYAPIESGAYVLTAEEFHVPEPTATVTMGSTVRGHLTESSALCRRRGARIEYYTLTVENPIEVQIDLASTQVDAYLFLEDEAGELMAENDDRPGSTDSRIIEQLAPGTYRIGASAFDRHETGAFSLTVGVPD